MEKYPQKMSDFNNLSEKKNLVKKGIHQKIFRNTMLGPEMNLHLAPPYIARTRFAYCLPVLVDSSSRMALRLGIKLL